MRQKPAKTENSRPPVKQQPEPPRIAAVKRILSIAQLIRIKGDTESASEALEWESQLTARLRELEQNQTAMAA